jgi:chromosomal replication initiation ATPase DnaA
MAGTVERDLSMRYAAARGRLRRIPSTPSVAAALDPDDEGSPAPPPVSCRFVFAHVCAFYGVSAIDLCSARRPRWIVRPRQVAMHLARTLTLKSLPEIGSRLGERNHTTVLHGLRRIAAQLPRDLSLARDIAELTRRITNRENPGPS